MDKNICKEPTKIENYELAKADSFKGWRCHHRLETHFSDGTLRPANARISMAELIALGMYYDRPPEELIYMRTAEHNSLHHKGKTYSKESRMKMSKSHKDNLNDEVRKRISEGTKKGMTPEIRKHISEMAKGRKQTPEQIEKKRQAMLAKHLRWYTDGITNIKTSSGCPEGFHLGRTVSWNRKKEG